jgi:transposase
LFIAALGEEKFGRAAIAFLRKYADPAKVVKMGIGKFKSFWRRHSKGQETQERAEKIFQACQKVEELHRDLREKGKLPFDYSIMQDELNFELDRMALAESDAHKVHLEIQELYHKIDPKRTLETIVGIGPTIAPCIEALVGNIERFSNGKKFVSYAGLAPRKSKSGLSDPAMPITKTGQPILRKYFYLAADVARQYDPELAAYYARRYVAGDHHNHIVIALARKMAWRVYAILKRRSEYRRTQKEQGENKTMKPAQYILRTADGKEVEKKEARKLIVENYARKVVAPERDARDRSQKGKKEAVKSAKKDELSSIKANRKSRASELQQLINGIVDATKF